MNRFFNFSKKNPYIILTLVIIITIIMSFGVSKVSITEDREEFLPESHTSYKVLKEYENLTGKLITEAIMVEGEDLTSAKAFTQIEKLTNEIWNHEELKDYILWIRSYPGFLIPALEDEVENWESLSDHELEEKIDKLLAQPGIKKDTGIYISEDRKGAVITAIINNNLSESVLHEKTNKLHDITDYYNEKLEGFTLSNTGTISTDQAVVNGIKQDLLFLIPIAAIFIIIVLYLTFRRFLDAILPFIVLGLGIIWMVGTMGLIGMPFYANFTIIVPLLLGLGIDYDIYLLTRYYQERRKKNNSEVSAMNAVKTVGVAIFLTVLTTIIGFLSFGTSEMPPIKNFGFIAGLGVFYIFILANTMLPSLLVIRDRKKRIDEVYGSSWWQDKIGNTLMKMGKLIFNNSKIVIFGTIFITVLAIFPMMNLSTTMSSHIMMPKGAEAVETQKALEGYFRGYGSESKAMVLVEGDIYSTKTLEIIANLQKSIINNPKNKNLIMGTTSLADLVKKENEGQIPQNDEQLTKILEEFKLRSDPKYGKIMLSDNKTAINISFETDTMEEEIEATEIIREEIKKLSNEKDIEINILLDGNPAVSGMPVVFSDIARTIKPDLIASILFAIILVTIVLAIIFKSLLLGLIGAVPVSLTLIWELGLLGILKIPLNVMNMLVSSIAIGVGIDYTIHIMYRFKEEWIGNKKEPKEAMLEILKNTGGAMFSAAITTIGVLVIIAFSSSPMLVSFGWLSALVIFLSLIGALIVLPIILVYYAEYKYAKN